MTTDNQEASNTPTAKALPSSSGSTPEGCKFCYLSRGVRSSCTSCGKQLSKPECEHRYNWNHDSIMRGVCLKCGYILPGSIADRERKSEKSNH